MIEIVVTAKNEEDTAFLIKLLKSLKVVSSVRIATGSDHSEKKLHLLSESSLAEDWLSTEDDRWDEALKQ